MTDDMQDDPTDKMIDAALMHVPFDGWTETTFRAAMKDAEVAPAVATGCSWLAAGPAAGCNANEPPTSVCSNAGGEPRQKPRLKTPRPISITSAAVCAPVEQQHCPRPEAATAAPLLLLLRRAAA